MFDLNWQCSTKSWCCPNGLFGTCIKRGRCPMCRLLGGHGCLRTIWWDLWHGRNPISFFFRSFVSFLMCYSSPFSNKVMRTYCHLKVDNIIKFPYFMSMSMSMSSSLEGAIYHVVVVSTKLIWSYVECPSSRKISIMYLAIDLWMKVQS